MKFILATYSGGDILFLYFHTDIRCDPTYGCVEKGVIWKRTLDLSVPLSFSAAYYDQVVNFPFKILTAQFDFKAPIGIF